MPNDPNPYWRRRPSLVWSLWAVAAAVAIIVFALLIKRCGDGGGGKGTSTAARGGTAFAPRSDPKAPASQLGVE